MTYRFLHVGAAYPVATPNPAHIDAVLNEHGGDWVRYSSHTWIIWTDVSPTQLFNAIYPRLALGEQVLIAPIDLDNRNGLLAPWVWQWVDSKRRNQNTTVDQILRGLAGYGLLGEPPKR